MSRYDSDSTQSGSTDGESDYADQTTLKLNNNSAIRLTPSSVNTYTNEDFGTSFIANYSAAELIDGVVFQREDKPGTWKIFSAGKFFHLNPEDGLVYESYDEEENEYTGEMSAQDILESPRVSGFSENHFGDDYYYTPVGVVIEEAGDVAVNDDLDVEATSEPAIDIGEASTLTGNKTWVRTFAKLLTEEGNEIINDNGDDPTGRDEEDTNPKYMDFDWLTTEEPTLREELEGRELELWITEETTTWDDGSTTTYNVPNLADSKTNEFVQIKNGDKEGDSTEASEGGKSAAATDGGTVTESTDNSGTESPDTTADAADDSGKGGLPDGVPNKLDSLLDYCARNGYEEAEGIKSFAADETDDPESVDWEAAAEFVRETAE